MNTNELRKSLNDLEESGRAIMEALAKLEKRVSALEESNGAINESLDKIEENLKSIGDDIAANYTCISF